MNEATKGEDRGMFNGDDYIPARDEIRLSGQLRKIFALMQDGQRRTLENISALTGEPPASVSAQLRHLRKPRFGGYRVNKYHMGAGLYEYEVLAKPPEPARSGGFSDQAKAELRSAIALEFGVMFLVQVSQLIEDSDQVGLRGAVREHLKAHKRDGEVFVWQGRIQRASEL